MGEFVIWGGVWNDGVLDEEAVGGDLRGNGDDGSVAPMMITN